MPSACLPGSSLLPMLRDTVFQHKTAAGTCSFQKEIRRRVRELDKFLAAQLNHEFCGTPTRRPEYTLSDISLLPAENASISEGRMKDPPSC